MPSPFADPRSIYRIIRAAQRAPSVYNTQPWSFWIRADNCIELRPHMAREPGHPGVWLDRQLQHTDQAARELTISCGAALFNLRMAIRVTGHEIAVWLLPDPVHDPTLLASVEIMINRIRPPTAEEQELYDAIPRRHTYRWPFTGRRVHHNIITELLLAAAKEKGWLRELYPFQVTYWLHTAARAEQELQDSPWYRAELREWTNRADLLGVPKNTYGPQPMSRNSPVRDFSVSSPNDWLGERFESRPQLLSLATDYNRPLDWLRAGQALQRVLLTAAHYDVAASFLTQSLEFADHQQLADNRRTGRLWPSDRVRLPGRIQLADDRHRSRRWPNRNGWRRLKPVWHGESQRSDPALDHPSSDCFGEYVAGMPNITIPECVLRTTSDGHAHVQGLAQASGLTLDEALTGFAARAHAQAEELAAEFCGDEHEGRPDAEWRFEVADVRIAR